MTKLCIKCIKQKMAIAILLGVIFVGIGGLFSYESYEVRKEGVPPTMAWWAERFENVGNFLMIIAPVILIIVDWRNIFPAIKKHKDK